jgi:hypothetical protein
VTHHELRYCRFLLQRVQDLYIDKEAMSTLLDAPSRKAGVMSDWRMEAAAMSADPVFRSSVEANLAPLFERLREAINNGQGLARLMEGRSQQ